MSELNEDVRTLVELGKRQGFLTFDRVNDLLSSDEPDARKKVQALMDSFETMGIDLVTQDEAEERLAESDEIGRESSD